MYSLELHDQARALLTRFMDRNAMLATAESCTGGLVAGLLTEVPGSSEVLDRGWVTYSYESKRDLLGIPFGLLHEKGAVDPEVARLMALGALERADPRVQVTLAVTGVAGPGHSGAKPTGLVYIAALRRGEDPRVEEFHFGGGRTDVRLAAVRAALTMAVEALG